MRFLLAVLLLVAFEAHADLKTFTWTPPTQYTNGAPIGPNELDHYILTCTPSGSIANIPAPATSVQQTFTTPGTYVCSIAVAATNGNVSGPSNQVNFTITPPTPNAPTGLSVN